MKKGHCSKCLKVWTLETEQGQCQWCGEFAVCQRQRTQALRSFKSRPRTRKEQDNHNGNGYDRLTGIWATYYKVASKFAHKARANDRGDLLHDIMLTFADIEHNNDHKPFTEPMMYRIASCKVADYWREQYRHNNGLDCGSCSSKQRAQCKADNLYGQCPKAIRLESLSKPVTDGEGNLTELGDLIADDSALDLAEWIDNKTFLLGCPQRLIQIAYKKREGEALSNQEHQYLWRFRQKEQMALV